MDGFVNELFGTLPTGEQLARVTLRLLAAVVLGAVIGLQREIEAKPAGLRTHILVTLGAAIFVMVPAEAGMLVDDLSRVIQGTATGIGFIGAGAILKLRHQREIHGLTTAATLWMATAIGLAVGLGQIALATLSVMLTWIVLTLFVYIDMWLARNERPAGRENQPAVKAREAIADKR